MCEDTLNYAAFEYYLGLTIQGVYKNRYSHNLDLVITIYEEEFLSRLKNNKGVFNIFKNKNFNIMLVGEKSINYYLYKILADISADDGYKKLEKFFADKFLLNP